MSSRHSFSALHQHPDQFDNPYLIFFKKLKARCFLYGGMVPTAIAHYITVSNTIPPYDFIITITTFQFLKQNNQYWTPTTAILRGRFSYFGEFQPHIVGKDSHIQLFSYPSVHQYLSQGFHEIF